MRSDTIAASIIAVIALQGICILAAGCSSTRIQREIDRLPWRDQTPPAEQPSQPDPAPVQLPAPAAAQFVWAPAGDTIRVTVPRGHWQWSITVTSPSVHHTQGLHPNTRGGGRSVPGGVEYTLSGGGQFWYDRSIAIDPKGNGAIVFFINLTAPDPKTGWTAHHWVIPDPRQLTVIQP